MKRLGNSLIVGAVIAAAWFLLDISIGSLWGVAHDYLSVGGAAMSGAFVYGIYNDH